MLIRSLSVAAVRVGLFAALALLGVMPAARALASPPPPSFTTSPSPQAGQPVTFVPSDTGVVQYIWNFGDGSQSVPTTSSTSHTYAHGGLYTVTLTATGSDGTTSQTSQQIPVGPPTAAFNPTQATVLAGSGVHFDGTQSSDPFGTIPSSGYSWNFGDGSGASGSQPTHSYTTPGTYNVTLRVTDNGESSAITHQVTVIAPPPVQTLVESIIPAPILVKFGSPTMIGNAIVDLHWRLFCPGKGPACRTTIAERKSGVTSHRRTARAAAGNVLVTRPNGNAELALHLTSSQQQALAKNHHLAFSLSIVSKRGAEKVTNFLRFKLTKG